MIIDTTYQLIAYKNGKQLGFVHTINLVDKEITVNNEVYSMNEVEIFHDLKVDYE